VDISQGRVAVVEFHFTNSESKRKTFLYENVNRKTTNFKTRGTSPLRSFQRGMITSTFIDCEKKKACYYWIEIGSFLWIENSRKALFISNVVRALGWGVGGKAAEN